MKQFVLLLFLVLIISCNKTTRKEIITTISEKSIPSLQKNYQTLNVYGNVESIICFNYKQYIPNSDLDYLVTKNDYKFDEKGNVSEEKVYMEDEVLQSRNQYFYDNFRNCLKTKSFGKDTILKYTSIIQLNKKGLKVSEKTINGFGTEEDIRTYETITDTLIVYNSYSTKDPKDISKIYQKCKNGNIISETYVQGTVLWESKYEYDNANNKTLQSTISAYDHHTWKWKYNKNNQPVFWQVHDFKKNVINEMLTEYDEHGNKSKITYIENGVLNNKKSYIDNYIYDHQHNWTKRSRFRLNGNKVSILERKISYYK